MLAVASKKFIDTTGPVRFVGRWGLITTLGGGFSILLNFVILLIGTSYGYKIVSQPCEDPCQIYGQLNAANFTDLQRIGISPDTYATTYVIILWVFAVIAYTAAGFLLWKKPGELLPFSAALLIMSLPSVEGQFVFFSGVFQDYPILATLFGIFNIPASFLPTYLYITFPNGKFKGKVFFLLFMTLAVAPVLWQIYQFVFNIPGDSSNYNGPSLPLAFFFNFLTVLGFYIWERNFTFKNSVRNLFLVAIGCLIILVNASFLQFLATPFILLYRLRVLTPRERVSTKWLIYGTSFFNLMLILFLVVLPMFPNLLAPGAYWFIPINLVGFFGCGVNMTGILIAILYGNAFDLNLVIKRTVVYSSLSILIVGIYLGSVVTLQELVRWITGQESGLAIVGATLVAALLFQPLRQIIQNFVDRRFYRRKYNAARTIAALNANLRNETDLAALTSQVRAVVDETMQPEMITIWVRKNIKPSPIVIK